MHSDRARADTRLAILFGAASFCCSALIFWLEPLVGKQLLPLVGGAPAVWNVCLLFFQAALLGGYALAHALTRIRSVFAQAAIYAAVAVSAFLLLPVQFATDPGDPSQPVRWLFEQLASSVLLPFVALAASAPLLQHWYSRSRAASAEDPYFLYAASNTGSLLALLAFPILIEPRLRLQTQNELWAMLFIAAAAVVFLSAVAVRASTVGAAMAVPLSTDADSRSVERPSVGRPSVRAILWWMTLAAIPSSLLMGVTNYLTADIAPVPLLWVVPLALYLLTFIVAFGPMRAGMPSWYSRVVIILAVIWCMLYRLQATDPLLLLVTAHLVVFVALALGAHTRLSASRPAARHLTIFYLAIAAGGAIGGAFNAIAAPQLFLSYAEYPLAVLVAVFVILRGSANFTAQPREKLMKLLVRDILPAAAVTAVTIIALASVSSSRIAIVIAGTAAPLVAAYMLSGRTLRFVLILAAVLLTTRLDPILHNRVVRANRNFYGVLRVTTDDAGRFTELRHGNTLHGASEHRAGVASPPLMYYWQSSPIADVLREMQDQKSSMRVGVVGLGVGTLAWYARPGDVWTFYEINPAIIEIAQDTSSFRYLQNSRADSVLLVPGDARFSLRSAPPGSYDLLILDAFTSDAIPQHLLTAEAVDLYLRTLKPDGLLAFHVSNRYLDLSPGIAAIARSRSRRAFLREVSASEEQRAARIESTEWLVIAPDSSTFARSSARARWSEVTGAGRRMWTDDYSNIWSALAR